MKIFFLNLKGAAEADSIILLLIKCRIQNKIITLVDKNLTLIKAVKNKKKKKS